MLKKLFLSFVMVATTIMVSSQAFATNHNITIANPGPGWTISPCPLPGTAGDTWTFINGSAALPILVKVWNQSGNSVTSYPIAASGNAVHTIVDRDCEVKVFNQAGTQELVECGTHLCLDVPTLTQWGVIGLVVLLIGSTLLIMLKRRKAAVPA